MKITRANLNHLDVLAHLFDQYRQFYEQEADFTGCRTYIRQRIMNDESVIFIAQTDAGETIGFIQLYGSFCSVAMKKILYLYDLFVTPAARRTGVGTALMTVAKEYGQTYGADRLTLQTAIDNVPGQTLYESLGYEKEGHFYTYNLAL